jgi:hypothetical protein
MFHIYNCSTNNSEVLQIYGSPRALAGARDDGARGKFITKFSTAQAVGYSR